MFISLRSRIWISYAIIIGVTLTTVAMGLFLSINSSPVLYRQVVLRLRIAQAALTSPLNNLMVNNPGTLQTFLNRKTLPDGIRVIVVDDHKSIIGDSNNAAANQNISEQPIQLESLGRRIKLPDNLAGQTTSSAIFRDASGTIWIYTAQMLRSGHFLIVAAQRPRLQLTDVLRDELLTPILFAGGLALFLALILSLSLGRWIASPLQNMASTVSNLTTGEQEPINIPVTGPKEVQLLARAFNQMHSRVLSSQKSQRDFIANISHELKTPLTSIQGFSQAIIDGTSGSTEANQQAAQIIYDESDRMSRMVIGLLTIARLDEQNAVIRQQPVRIIPLLENVIMKFSHAALEADVRIEVHLHPENSESPSPALFADPVCIGDEDQFFQVFANLLDNAIKYTPAGGLVTFAAVIQPRHVLIMIADSGPGIPQIEQNRVFERFYQVEKSRHREKEQSGVGLGLAIAKQIIQMHNGQIWIENNPVTVVQHTALSMHGNCGAAFIVKLPLQTT